MGKLFQIFLIFSKIGAFTIGGGYAMLPVMEREILKSGWVTQDEIVDVLAISQSAPGIIAVNASIYLGYKIASLKGAIVAALGVTLPSFFSILIIYYAFGGNHENEVVQKIFLGIRAVSVGMVLNSAINYAKNSVFDVPSLALLTLSLILLLFLNINVAIVLLIGCLAGIFGVFNRE